VVVALRDIAAGEELFADYGRRLASHVLNARAPSTITAPKSTAAHGGGSPLKLFC